MKTSTWLLFVSFLLILVFPGDVCCQMTSVVNSLADDEFAHPHDKTITPDFDESMDGICEDSLGRCTLRAALEEASNIGIAAHVTFGGLSGNLTVDDSNGPFAPPDFSIITGVQQRVIIYGGNSGTSVLMALGNATQVTGLGFAHGLIGLIVEGENNLVGANQYLYSNYFHHFSQNGILVTGNSNTIAGNRIGIAFDGTPIGNQFGIFITGADNTIGGILPGEGNIISGNEKGIGVYTLSGSTYIYGNKIGTDSAGTVAVGNQVGIDNIGPNVHIGNDTPGGRNIISGNTQSGILVGTMAQENFIQDNYIGTDPSGTIAVPNRDGITLGPGSFTTLVKHNRINYNFNNGILISGIPQPSLESALHVIEGNEILSNGFAGIALTGAANHNTIGSSLTGILEPNQIKFNGNAGVLLAAQLDVPQQNTIRRNSFQDNNVLGIHIAAGQGNIQPPVLTNFSDPGGGTMTITGTHDLAGALIDIYTGDANQSQSLEGLQWLGEVVADAGGNFSVSLPSCNCTDLVATATDILGNTSEFSDGLSTPVADGESIKHHVSVYPNPFHTDVNIQFSMKQADYVTLRMFDITGKSISTLHQGDLPAGGHAYTWMPGPAAPGMYYYHLQFGAQPDVSGKVFYHAN
jgi:hypothetical protein